MPNIPSSRRNLWAQDTRSSGRSRGRGQFSNYMSRNKSLVLGGGIETQEQNEEAEPQATPLASDSQQTPQQWIQVKERHMQLINASVYNDKVEAKAKAIEETKKHREEQRDNAHERKEMAKLRSYMKKFSQQGVLNYRGTNYRIIAGGNKLERIHGASQGCYNLVLSSIDGLGTSQHIPMKVKIGGVFFLRSKNGNLWRRSVVKSSR